MKKYLGASAAVLTAVCLFVSASAASPQENHVHNSASVETYAAEMETTEKQRQEYTDNIEALVIEGTPPAKNAEEAAARSEKQALEAQLETSRKGYIDAVKELKKIALR